MMNITVKKDLLWTFPHCPTAPDESIDWMAVLAQFLSLYGLEKCEQNPIYHAEGNVWIHTKLVCEALVLLPDWQAMNAQDRSILFAAALFHDIAKPNATQVGEDGNITAKGHVNLGARMTREILKDLHTPFAIREAIVAIVKYESLPIWFWDKPQPLRSIIKVSQLVRCDWLALMAEADILGRICQDRVRLLETIEFFREFCREYDCFDKAYAFDSDHSRFIYFNNEEADPTYAAYDTSRFEVILMCGLPGTGKDYWIEQNYPDLPVISLDKLRQTMGILPTGEQGEIIRAAKNIAKGYLQTQTSFIWNATNIVKSTRQGLIRLFADYDARIRIVYLEVPIAQVLAQNNSRQQPVPKAVIYRYHARLEIPDRTEAHQVDYCVDP
jgi:putative nucleotidyltransferase with HDIG domain